MTTSADKGLYLNINSTGWIFSTVIFLMLIFIMAIVNAIFFIRIYNQSKDRDSGTGITGLTVTGSLVIGVISIIVGLIAFGWSLYLISKIYKSKDAVGKWWEDKKTTARNFYNEKLKKARNVEQTAVMIQASTGKSMLESLSEAERICSTPGSGFIRDNGSMSAFSSSLFESN
jgi:hypothetical protein